MVYLVRRNKIINMSQVETIYMEKSETYIDSGYVTATFMSGGDMTLYQGHNVKAYYDMLIACMSGMNTKIQAVKQDAVGNLWISNEALMKEMG